ncbi:MAG: hypothetical protein AAB871_01615, partial [Patescibacteria group bacterium]
RGDGGRELKTAVAETNQYTKVADLSGSFNLTASPKGDVALLQEPASQDATRKVFLVNLSDGKITPLLDRGNNSHMLFSPDGSKLLFTRANGQSGKPELWLYDFGAKTFKNLGLATSSLKAVWSADSKQFYYALPALIPSDDAALTAPTKDTLHVYDLGSAQGKGLEFSGPDADFREMLVKSDGKMLFFRNGWDGKIYGMNLK